MLKSELIKELQKSIDKFGDEEIQICLEATNGTFLYDIQLAENLSTDEDGKVKKVTTELLVEHFW